MNKLAKWFPVKRRTNSETGMQKVWGDNHPLVKLQGEMDRMFSDFFRDPFTGLELDWPRPFQSGSVAPVVDIEDKGKELKVSVELPGMDADDVEVNLRANALSIKGEKKIEESGEQDGYYMSERSYGAFQRVIPLPVEVEEDKVKAKFKKGVLTVKLPKSKKAKENTRKISVQSDD